MSVNGFSVDISEFDFAAKEAVTNYKRKTTNFLKKEGKSLKEVIQRYALTASRNGHTLQRKTGNFYNAITVQKPYNYYKENGPAKDSVKIYGKRDGSENGKGFHTHLIEQGREPGGWYAKCPTAKFVEEFFVYEKAREEYEGTFEANCEAYADEIAALF